MILSQSQPISERDKEYRIYFIIGKISKWKQSIYHEPFPYRNIFALFCLVNIIYISYTRKQVDRVPNSLNIEL